MGPALGRDPGAQPGQVVRTNGMGTNLTPNEPNGFFGQKGPGGSYRGGISIYPYYILLLLLLLYIIC